MAKYDWSYEDDIIAYFLQRAGLDGLLFTPAKIAELRGMSEDSLKMRVANFKSIATGSGLDNVAELSRRVFAEYQSVDLDQHKKAVMRLLMGE